MWTPETLAVVATAFLLAGFVKGVVGLGLPTVALALLTATLGLREAVALMLVPSFATNLWQGLAVSAPSGPPCVPEAVEGAGGGAALRHRGHLPGAASLSCELGRVRMQVSSVSVGSRFGCGLPVVKKHPEREDHT